MSEYRYVITETYRSQGEPSANSVRARPIPGQGFETWMNVECSTAMRDRHPVGTKFLIKAKLVENENGARFLYTYHGWEYKVLSDLEAQRYIHEREAGGGA